MEAAAPLRPDNVIANKIASVLSVSYTDQSMRQALESLDSRMKQGNTTSARRHLRSNTEAEIIKANGQFLKSFSHITEQIREIGTTVESLNAQYAQMHRAITQSTRSSGRLAKEAAELKDKQDQVASKKALLDAFDTTFVVSESEIEVLTSTAVPVDDKFFESLARVKDIYTNCEALLASESTSEGGVELMTSMSQHLDSAYSKLSFSVQHEFKTLLSGKYLQLGPKLRRSLAVLAERPSSLESTLSVLVDTRQKAISLEFMNALTSETANSKPIDFYAYDALRYVGDMMAWIHSAAVNEKENLDALFQTDSMSAGLAEGMASEPWWKDQEQQHNLEDARSTVGSLVDRITSILVKPLQVRIDQVLSTETAPTTIYQVSNVLSFYRATFQKHSYLGPESGLISALERFHHACTRQFRRCLEDRLSSFRDTAKFEPPPYLQPPDFLVDAMAELNKVLTSYETSIAYNDSDESTSTIRQIIEDMTEPYLEFCNRAASDMPDGMEMEIFQINCLDQVKMSLLLFSSLTDYKVQQLDSRIDELVEVLVARQFRSFLKSSHLQNWDQRHDLSDEQVVQQLAAQLDEWLPAATMESNLALQRLTSPRLGSTITLRASQQFATSFAEFRQHLSTLYDDTKLATIFPRTESQVRVLLALE